MCCNVEERPLVVTTGLLAGSRIVLQETCIFPSFLGKPNENEFRNCEASDILF